MDAYAIPFTLADEVARHAAAATLAALEVAQTVRFASASAHTTACKTVGSINPDTAALAAKAALSLSVAVENIAIALGEMSTALDAIQAAFPSADKPTITLRLTRTANVRSCVREAADHAFAATRSAANAANAANALAIQEDK